MPLLHTVGKVGWMELAQEELAKGLLLICTGRWWRNTLHKSLKLNITALGATWTKLGGTVEYSALEVRRCLKIREDVFFITSIQWCYFWKLKEIETRY